MIGRSYAMKVGMPADIVLFDASEAATIVREIRPALAGWKRGRKTFENPRGRVLR
jgi:cytosine deaminase